VSNDFFRRGVFDRKGLSAAGIHPFTVDQHLMFLGQKGGRG
jgi:hypothetical protein